MNERESNAAALRRLVREARAEQPPAVDFTKMEERLLSEVGKTSPARARSSSRQVLWLSLVAAAACAALWQLKSTTPPAVPALAPAPAEAAAALVRDGNALGVGTRVTTLERGMTVTHAGRATWKLAGHSSARLTELGERIALELERGSVLSEVVPSAKPETFVVETAGVRVAVHGTVFRVAVEGERVAVQVDQGVVAVGPRGGAAMFLLKAPAQGDFARDGRSGNIDGRPALVLGARPSESPKLARSRPVAAPSALSSAAPPIPSVALPSEPSINDIESGIARSVDVASDCFRRYTQSADGVQVTARTALSLDITAEGQATNVHFQPPLSPDAEACAGAGISSITFAKSERGARVTRMLELKR